MPAPPLKAQLAVLALPSAMLEELSATVAPASRFKVAPARFRKRDSVTEQKSFSFSVFDLIPRLARHDRESICRDVEQPRDELLAERQSIANRCAIPARFQNVRPALLLPRHAYAKSGLDLHKSHVTRCSTKDVELALRQHIVLPCELCGHRVGGAHANKAAARILHAYSQSPHCDIGCLRGDRRFGHCCAG